jgi:hypothetical protein
MPFPRRSVVLMSLFKMKEDEQKFENHRSFCSLLLSAHHITFSQTETSVKESLQKNNDSSLVAVA